MKSDIKIQKINKSILRLLLITRIDLSPLRLSTSLRKPLTRVFKDYRLTIAVLREELDGCVRDPFSERWRKKVANSMSSLGATPRPRDRLYTARDAS